MESTAPESSLLITDEKRDSDMKIDTDTGKILFFTNYSIDTKSIMLNILDWQKSYPM